MAISTSATLLLTVACILLLASPAHAFGAGNIASMSAIEGTNWRHGDIEDTLLQIVMSRAAGGKKFDKLMVARVYFGNWLRDYSQAIDVGTVKYVSAEAIRILLWVLGFMTFGYGTGEFEVTTERLGCYRPEDHIDNPKDYADNLDATDYDPRLRGLVNERVELAVDRQTGMKNYIANEHAGCMTSAEHVRKLFLETIRLGRSYARTGNKDELYESLRLLGTGTHCLEDFSAHSNYTELALIEMGARNEVYPLITGTFGGVDFIHSMAGEFNDKATQSEIQTLEDTIQEGSQGNTSMLKELLEKIPDGLFGTGDEKEKADDLQQQSNTAAMQNLSVTPKEPEEFTLQMQEMVKQIYPIMEYHDNIMKQISDAIEKIPILPDLIEQLENEVNVFVFSLLAPFVLPLIQQIKTELNEGSSEIIASSQEKQHIVFNDEESTDPTHSMLSKDHFSNVLNEPAGKIASGVLKWVVPQLIAAMDNESIDAHETVSRIISGVFHHPAQRALGDDGASDCRAMMFQTVQQWWQGVGQGSQQDLRRQLSRDGVLNGENHKPGEHDTGHGSAGGVKMHKHSEGCGAGEGMIGELLSAMTGGNSAKEAGQHYGRPDFGGRGGGGGGRNNDIAENIGQAVGGGLLGGLIGGVLGEVMSGGDNDNRQDNRQNQNQTYQNQYQTQDGGRKQEYTEYGRNQQTNTYQQQQYSETTYGSGRKVEEFKSFEQDDGGRGGGYAYEARVERRADGEIRGQERVRRGSEEKEKKWKKKKDDNDSEEDDEYSEEKKEKKNKKKSYGRDEEDSEEEKKQKRYSGGRKRSKSRERYQERQGGYGGGGRQEQSYGDGRQEQSYGGGRQEYGGGSQEQSYGGGRQEYSGGRQEQSYGGGGNEYGRQEYGGGNQGYQGGRDERQEGYGGGRQEGFGRDNERRGSFGREERGGRGGGGREEGRGGYGGGDRRYGEQEEERRGW